MKLQAIAVVAVLAFAATASADTYTDTNGTIYYPDGSVITDVSVYGHYPDSVTTLTFTGPLWSGTVDDRTSIGADEIGIIQFDAPPTGYLWSVTRIGDLYMNFNTGQDHGSVEIGNCTPASPPYSGSIGTLNPCSNPITINETGAFGMTWDTVVNGDGGITSLNLSPIDSPEPATYSLLGAGLIGLGFLKRMANFRLAF